MASKLALRFDVDTHKCMRDGVPALLDLARKNDIRFTFFVNPGKAVSLPLAIMELLRNGGSPETATHLSALRKLGLKDFLLAATLNPKGSSYSATLRRISDEGHELGLHGGRNHQRWAKQADTWSTKRLYSELIWGIQSLQAQGVFQDLGGFASPNWNHPQALDQILADLGFRYCADEHGFGRKPTIRNHERRLEWVSTQLTAEPGGVAFFENIVAADKDPETSIREALEAAESEPHYAAIYDHPYFAGCKGLDLVQEFVNSARERRFRFVTLGQILDD